MMRPSSDTFAEAHMTGRTAATQVVVVHRGQIVVDERVGVNQFEGTGRREQLFRARAEGLARGEDERGAQTLAARE